ncbi:MAG: prepilin-type N-terminal cleavage/methylation domain-containing protein [Deltaproteobacteria bacterium]
MRRTFKENRGLTLIELLVALVISAVIIAALYRTFVGQQKTYTVQEQVVDMRQNVRGAISNMMRELRMAGFGGVGMVLPITIGSDTYQNVVNRNTPSTPPGGWITIVTALTSSSQGATLTGTISSYKITVSDLTDFDMNAKKYISIGGVESNTITGINTGTKELTLNGKLVYKHSAGIRIYPIRAISYYAGLRDENTGGGAQPTAENIESVQFEYLDAQGNTVASDAAVQMIRVRVTAKTDMVDPEYKSGDGYRRREISSNIQLRNVTISP